MEMWILSRLFPQSSLTLTLLVHLLASIQLSYGKISIYGTAVKKGNLVHHCKPGHGYPLFCPMPGDPSNHTLCCRHLQKARCCEERATRVCMRQRPSGFRRGATGVDPDPKLDAIFCPGPGDPDNYDVCCWRRYSSFCCSTAITPIIFGIVFGGLAVLLVVSWVGIFIMKKRGTIKLVTSYQDIKEQQMKDSQKQPMAT